MIKMCNEYIVVEKCETRSKIYEGSDGFRSPSKYKILHHEEGKTNYVGKLAFLKDHCPTMYHWKGSVYFVKSSDILVIFDDENKLTEKFITNQGNQNE